MNIHFYYCDGFYDNNDRLITDSIDCVWPFPTPPRVGDIISDYLIHKLIGSTEYYTDGYIYVNEVQWSYSENYFKPLETKYELYIVLGKKKNRMNYPRLKQAKLTHVKIAKAFGYKNVNSFRCSSAHKRIMQGIENILTLQNEN